MRIVGICGSPKSERSSTRFLLEKALEAVSVGQTMLLNISDFNIQHCTGCDSCVRKKPCPQSSDDDMPEIEKKLIDADGIIIAAPSYFTSVPGVLKDFIDRSRAMKMNDHQLKDKVFGAITYAGLRYGGQEHVVDVLNRYALGQGMIVVGSVGSPVKHGTFGSGSLQTDEGSWRSAKDDELAVKGSALLGKRVAEIVVRLQDSGEK
ncbi:MAG: Iron-sulfur flavoprotein [Candidatus Thorarchaeota archaeon AB_25]|nr:MAG: Iron-sulfur flavoprotein [Candidatus Thorarchaeota archaeon AB_25]